ncbi:MAG: hypothetical protein K8J08_15035 [Thermoanaerobaculia bacterium]|nr:hypothetical protein [Thermoanaerobaculia bacterium]
MSKRFHLACPDCGSRITVDAKTGKLLDHSSRPESSPAKPDFDRLLKGLDADRNRAEARFKEEMAAHEDRSRRLDEKFEEAKRRAEAAGLEGRPDRPWDFD